MKLQGQVALVTGASRGIGRAIAEALSNEGADLVITGRSADKLEALKGEVESDAGRCSVVVADLAGQSAVDRVWNHCFETFGRLDILVNNAGIGSIDNPKPVVEYDDPFWELLLKVNLTVPYLFCKRALPGMIERSYGRIINIASIAGRMGVPHGAAYSASKHGLIGLTRTLALEVAENGITVNAICPGPVKSHMNDRRIAYDAERLGTTFAEMEARQTPMRRRLVPEEIAPLAVYLSSKASSGLTGQCINVDGGRLMS